MKIRAVQVCPSEIAVLHDGSTQIGPSEIRTAEIGSAKVGALQVSSTQVCLSEISRREIGFTEIRVRQLCLAQVYTTQISPCGSLTNDLPDQADSIADLCRFVQYSSLQLCLT